MARKSRTRSEKGTETSSPKTTTAAKRKTAAKTTPATAPKVEEIAPEEDVIVDNTDRTPYDEVLEELESRVFFTREAREYKKKIREQGYPKDELDMILLSVDEKTPTKESIDAAFDAANTKYEGIGDDGEKPLDFRFTEIDLVNKKFAKNGRAIAPLTFAALWLQSFTKGKLYIDALNYICGYTEEVVSSPERFQNPRYSGEILPVGGDDTLEGLEKAALKPSKEDKEAHENRAMQVIEVLMENSRYLLPNEPILVLPEEFKDVELKAGDDIILMDKVVNKPFEAQVVNPYPLSYKPYKPNKRELYSNGQAMWYDRRGLGFVGMAPELEEKPSTPEAKPAKGKADSSEEE